MSKKIIAVLLAVALSCSIFSFAASAQTVSPAAAQNAFVGSVKLKAVEAMVAQANAQIAAAVKKAQATQKNDVAWLVKVTDTIAKTTIKAAAALGVTVVCEYEFYWVDGQYVAIDPLKVAY